MAVIWFDESGIRLRRHKVTTQLGLQICENRSKGPIRGLLIGSSFIDLGRFGLKLGSPDLGSFWTLNLGISIFDSN